MSRGKAPEIEEIDYEVFADLEPLDPNLPWDWDMASKAKKQKQAKEKQMGAPPPMVEKDPPEESHSYVSAQQQMLPPPPPPPPPVLVEAAVETQKTPADEGCGDEVVVRRPDWLPPDWYVRARKRKNGQHAGRLDKYFEDPTQTYQFRSKKYVLNFLECKEIMSDRQRKKEKEHYNGSAGVPEFKPPKVIDSLIIFPEDFGKIKEKD
ncbi:uncharacterized protein LOC122062742 [Macadamia integrifolia]|uniref:uncharacterized protein LOC122062742 n=1 Tax=Macadamia integrifolia TaxID=60698 RepID=UPI001C4F0D08|nr:uncharacterized protein LOC122062742 [Macadamia integrifolia]